MICATLSVQWFDKRQSGENKQLKDIPKKKTQYTSEQENGRKQIQRERGRIVGAQANGEQIW